MIQPKTSLTKKDLENDPKDLFEKFLIEAETDGRLEGRLEGERNLTLRLFECKFGELPPRRRSQIESALRDQLNTWAARLLTATSLAAVFDDADPAWQGETMTQPKTGVTWEDLGFNPLDLINKHLNQARAAGIKEGRLEGMREGWLTGLEKGKLEGGRGLIRRQCRYKFGELSESQEDELESDSVDQLNAWCTRILTATSLDEMFENPD